LLDLDVFSKCWICEGWSNISFKITKDDVEAAIIAIGEWNDEDKVMMAGNVGKFQINIHFNYDGYKAHPMNEGYDNGTIPIF